jgi:hypothetical protein
MRRAVATLPERWTLQSGCIADIKSFKRSWQTEEEFMGSIKPWHLILLLCCMLSVTAIVAAVLAIVFAARRRRQ